MKITNLLEAEQQVTNKTWLIFQQRALDSFDLGEFDHELTVKLTSNGLVINFPDHYDLSVNVYMHDAGILLAKVLAKGWSIAANESDREITYDFVCLSQGPIEIIGREKNETKRMMLHNARKQYEAKSWEDAVKFFYAEVNYLIKDMFAQPGGSS